MRNNSSPALYVSILILLSNPGSQLEAGQGVININQHRVEEDTGCTYPRTSCLFNEHLPFQALEGSDNEIDAFSYHVNPYQQQALTGRFCQAVCDSTYASRPKFISSDWRGINNAQASTWLQQVCSDASTNKGRLHFEHFEPSLSDAASSGACIGGYSTWDTKAQGMIQYFSASGTNCGNELDPNGTLRRGNDASPQGQLEILFWRTPGSVPPAGLTRVTLTGFGFMGAVAMGDRLDIPAYLRSLRRPYFAGNYHRGANLTRVWATEQWTAQAPDESEGCETPYQTAGPVPFDGILEPNGYDLRDMSWRYFSHLREFVQAAADRGIVVQYTLFDKHGLLWKGSNCTASWPSSPYNASNNNTVDPSYLWPAYPATPCACNVAGFLEPETPEAECPAHPDFTSGSLGIAQDHKTLIERSAQEIGGIGNVLFEIVNEAIAGVDWPGANQGWQKQMAANLRMQLPFLVARDAYNAETQDRDLALKPPDAGSGTWSASNARVYRSPDPGTAIQMGVVRPNAASSLNYMRGSLSIGTGGPRTAIAVRGNVSRLGNSMELGVANNADASAGLVRVEVGPAVIMAACSRVAIVKRVGGVLSELASTCAGVWDGNDLRLHVNLVNGTASVFADSSPVGGLQDIPLGTMPANLSYVYFRGSKASGNYILGDGEIDNFEADVYCTITDSPYGCTP